MPLIDKIQFNFDGRTYVNHLWTLDQQGKVYCYRHDREVVLRQWLDKCSTCPYWYGTVQGDGVECCYPVGATQVTMKSDGPLDWTTRFIDALRPLGIAVSDQEPVDTNDFDTAVRLYNSTYRLTGPTQFIASTTCSDGHHTIPIPRKRQIIPTYRWGFALVRLSGGRGF